MPNKATHTPQTRKHTHPAHAARRPFHSVCNHAYNCTLLCDAAASRRTADCPKNQQRQRSLNEQRLATMQHFEIVVSPIKRMAAPTCKEAVLDTMSRTTEDTNTGPDAIYVVTASWRGTNLPQRVGAYESIALANEAALAYCEKWKVGSIVRHVRSMIATLSCRCKFLQA